jgi:hypothetical protein
MAQAVPMMMKKRYRKTVYFQPNKRSLALENVQNDVDMLEQPAGMLTQRHSTTENQVSGQLRKRQSNQTSTSASRQNRNSNLMDRQNNQQDMGQTQIRPYTAK